MLIRTRSWFTMLRSVKCGHEYSTAAGRECVHRLKDDIVPHLLTSHNFEERESREKIRLTCQAWRSAQDGLASHTLAAHNVQEREWRKHMLFMCLA